MRESGGEEGAMSEKWREAPGHPDYEVSDHGRVRRKTAGPGTWPGRVLNCRPDTSGYLFHQYGPARARKRFWVHLLVCEAFHGLRPPGMLADHVDRDRSHNHPPNLRWVTRSQNVRHGNEVAVSKLNSEVVKVVRHVFKRHNRRGMQLLLARLHGVTHEAIRKVKTGESWGGAPSVG